MALLKALLDSVVPGDGSELHHKVPPERWCVTRGDLLQLRRLIQEAVAEGSIVPVTGERHSDNFDPTDGVIGPSIYTLNRQFIKVVTAKVGNMSWALMLHPEGLKCDLFVTHMWGEGAYEFIDKVCHSWPRRCLHAYCCMLSNPQNLDIGDMIGRPRESPFAKALSSAQYMLVVPNHCCSIYSRIWCAYEAFLAYEERKCIFTASAPLRGLWRSLLPIVIVVACVLTAVTAFLVGTRTDIAADGWPVGFTWGGDYIAYRVGHFLPHALIICFLCTVAAARMPPSKVTLVLVYVSAVAAATITAVHGYRSAVIFGRSGFHTVAGQVGGPFLIGSFLCIASVTAVVDRRWRLELLREASQLRDGYTGRLQDAQCSRPQDGEAIHAELAASGHAEAVNQGIKVLLDAGLSSPSLRTAVDRTGTLEEAGYWNLSLLGSAWFVCSVLPALIHIVTSFGDAAMYTTGLAGGDETCLCIKQLECGGPDYECAACKVDFAVASSEHCIPLLERWQLWLTMCGLLQALIWLLLFLHEDKDKRSFGARVTVTLRTVSAVFVALSLMLDGEVLDILQDVSIILSYVCFSPLELVLLALGPGPTSKIPCLGKLVVKSFMGQTLRSCLRWSGKRQSLVPALRRPKQNTPMSASGERMEASI